MQLPSKYDPKQVEDHWYSYWMEHGYFYSVPNDREPYTIVIPPPNVTGVLHMGHMMNNTIQDVLIRRARQLGRNACWVPGTDHASIATEAKVVGRLREKGIRKSDISREEFIDLAWEWTHEFGGVILEQLKKLGCSCDWKRTKFTMDEDMSASVLQVFVDLYRQGNIYRGYRMVNWDPEARTTLSDEEVVYEERNGMLYYLAYAVVGSDEKVIIATTRPETILGDTAVCIHPDDERYHHLRNKKVIVPVCDRVVPIIVDTYVAMEFGTGCLKVTPAHDPADKLLGDKHKLQVIDIFNPDATLNSYGLHYEGKDRFVVRKEIVKELEEKGFVVKKESYLNKVGTSERTGAVIEPRLLDQWFLKMQELSKPALDAVLKKGDIRLYPKKFGNTYRHWMENIRDWNISRQLWWGQRIPAYYYGAGNNEFVVAASIEEALEMARQNTGNAALDLTDLRQDEDVLDTWFSSWLWPISVFGGILEPDNADIRYYYPTSDLVTGPDILFFWVARMIMAGYEYREAPPFRNVYLTGLVRDRQGRKMSKSLGNSPDALQLIESYGADGVRVGLLLSAAAGNDLLFDENLCLQGKHFANKVWNAFRLIQGWEVAELPQPEAARLGLEWYASRFSEVQEEIEDNFEKYRISDALMITYKLIWDDFCSWLLEIVKPAFGEAIDPITFNEVIRLLEENLKLLHPFMPFLSEEIWQRIADRKPEEALIVAPWPAVGNVDKNLLKGFGFADAVITGIRTIRKEKQIPMKEPIELLVLNEEGVTPEWDVVIQKLTNVTSIRIADGALNGAFSFRVKSNEYFIPVKGNVDINAEITKLEEELEYTRGFLTSVRKKLSNERFVNHAPDNVIALERKKEADAEAKIETLEKSLANFG